MEFQAPRCGFWRLAPVGDGLGDCEEFGLLDCFAGVEGALSGLSFVGGGGWEDGLLHFFVVGRSGLVEGMEGERLMGN